MAQGISIAIAFTKLYTYNYCLYATHATSKEKALVYYMFVLINPAVILWCPETPTAHVNQCITEFSFYLQDSSISRHAFPPIQF